MQGDIRPGTPEPLGAAVFADGLNVAVYSAHATSIEVCLYDEAGEREVARLALPERTGDVFHGRIAGYGAGTRYGLRAHGPFEPAAGHRFNPAKLLVDPYATAIDRPFALHPAMFDRPPQDPGGRVSPDPTDSGPFVPKAIAEAARTLAAPLDRPRKPSDVVYELHVRGFTKLHPEVPEAIRGTLAGLAHPAAIDHLVRLGVGTVELMPLAAWLDERHLARLGLSNYWGYNPITMLAPDPRLAPGGMAEVATAVAALRAAGIDVLLDVVLNHTGEGDALGPTVSLRGLDSATYYRHAAEDPGRLVDDTGCGNTLALDRPAVLRLAMDALRRWAEGAGVDGFRFDLGTTLGRRADGYDPAAPLLQAIAQDPLLATKRIVAEPWDVGPGGYQLGQLPPRWGEWNDRYRDTVRRFWRGDAGVGGLATRLAGSSDVFGARHRPPSKSVNFLAAHDGFTLADLVAYTEKHNAANGEDNRDGHGENYSWNHGVEGPSDDPAVLAARVQDVRGLLLTLLASRGTPMLAMGDELGRSQQGNNNAYCQDGPIAWLDWSRADAGLAAFAARLVALRAAHPALSADRYLTGRPLDDSGIADVEWRTADGEEMQDGHWTRDRQLVAAFYAPADGDAPADRVVAVLNADDAATEVVLPDTRPGFAWRVAADSARPDAEGAPLPGLARLAVPPRTAMLVVEAPDADAARRAAGGTEPAVLDRLAAAAGIGLEWWDLDAKRHRVGADTKLALLTAMGLPAGSTAEARDSLAAIAERRDRRPLPAVVVAREGRTAEVAVRLAGGRVPDLHLERADGTLEAVPVPPDAPRRTVVAADGRTVDELVVTLSGLPVGAHRLVAGDEAASGRLYVVPTRCHLPASLAAGRRRTGLAAHLYSLRRAGDGGIGDFTALSALARIAGGAGAATLGLNPLHALSLTDRASASPYHPSDRRFLDPIYLDLARVPDIGPVPPAPDEGGLVDYPAVWRAKAGALADAYAAFRRRPVDDPLAAERARFIAAGGETLRRFAVFQAIAEANPGLSWRDWPAGLREPGSAAVAAFAAANADRVTFHLHLQWLADRQLAAAAEAGRAAGLEAGLYRDLAVGCAAEGAEAWASEGGYVAGVSIGAPPDPFTEDGQIWHLPPPDPNRMIETAYAGLDGLLAANMRHAGALRIDHAMALTRLFWVPDGAPALAGAYVAYPVDDLLGIVALNSRRAECMVVGEDLGVVPDGLREKLSAHDLLSYRVVPFEREASRFRRAASYPAKAVACASSHDLPPLAAWWRGHDLEIEQALGRHVGGDAAATRVADKARLAEAFEEAGVALDPSTDDTAAVVDAAHAFLAATPCLVALMQLDDLTGETEPLNVPGTDTERPNWRRRLSQTVEEIAAGNIPARMAKVAALRDPPATG